MMRNTQQSILNGMRLQGTDIEVFDLGTCASLNVLSL